MKDILFPIGAILVVVFIVSVNWTSIVGSPYLPTRLKKVRQMLEMAGVDENDVIYDLGSGDGRFLIMAAKKYGAKGYGIEIDPIRVWISKFLSLIFGVKDKVTIKNKSFFKVDMSDATVVVCFLLDETLEELFPKLNAELKPGTKIVANHFEFPHWKIKDYNYDAYLYEISKDRRV